MSRSLWICFGGAVGTGVGYLLALWAARTFGSSFPYGTLIVNVVGCCLIAALLHAALALAWSPTARAALTIGLLGGFTTYSSVNYETMRRFEEGALRTATLNVVLTVLVGFAAGWLGLVTARELLGR